MNQTICIKSFCLYALLAGLIVTASEAQGATTCTAIASGSWKSASTWSCGAVPGNGDIIVIPQGVTVTVDTTVNFASNSTEILDIYGTLSLDKQSSMAFGSGTVINIYATGSIINSNGSSRVNLGVGNGQSGQVFKGNGGNVLTGPTTCELAQNPICQSNVSLPITLVALTATYQADQQRVVLNWTTSSQTSNAYFTIERSQNLKQPEPIGQVAGADSSNELLAYVFDDNAPLPGTSYYRVLQTDYNGLSTYSQWVAVTTEPDAQLFSLSVWPNPTDGEQVNLVLDGSDGTDAWVTVYSANGQLVYSRAQTATAGQPLSLSFGRTLPAGMYLVRVSQTGRMVTRKLLVN